MLLIIFKFRSNSADEFHVFRLKNSTDFQLNFTIHGNLGNPHNSFMKHVVLPGNLSTKFDVWNSTCFQTNLRGFTWTDLPKNFLMLLINLQPIQYINWNHLFIWISLIFGELLCSNLGVDL